MCTAFQGRRITDDDALQLFDQYARHCTSLPCSAHLSGSTHMNWVHHMCTPLHYTQCSAVVRLLYIHPVQCSSIRGSQARRWSLFPARMRVWGFSCNIHSQHSEKIGRYRIGCRRSLGTTISTTTTTYHHLYPPTLTDQEVGGRKHGGRTSENSVTLSCMRVLREVRVPTTVSKDGQVWYICCYEGISDKSMIYNLNLSTCNNNKNSMLSFTDS